MDRAECLKVFQTIGNAFNAPVDTVGLLGIVAEAVVEEFRFKGCHFRLLSRDQQILEHVAAFGLSERFLEKGPVDAERSVSEALKGETVIVEDCSSDPRIQYPAEFAAEGIVSLVTVPLQTRGQVIGVMRLFAGETRSFGAEELEVIQVVASFCTSAITHSMFHGILRHVTESIRASLELDDVLEAIVRVITEDLRARGSFIQLQDRSGKRLDVAAAFGLGKGFLDRVGSDPGGAALEALDGECASVLDARDDSRIPFAEEAYQERFTSMLYVPLVVHERAMGVLCVVTHHRYAFSEDEQYLMTAIGEQCALAIRNAQMYDAVKRRCDTMMEDFQQWFEHVHTHSTGGQGPNA